MIKTNELDGSRLQVDPELWVVVKGSSARINRQRLRTATNTKGLNFGGDHLMIPRIVFDLLHFGPCEVTVFNSPFYTSGEDYAPEYWRVVRPPQADVSQSTLRSLARHDPLDGLHLLQLLLRAGRISADGTTAAAVSLSDLDYGRSVDQALPPFRP